MTYSQIIDFNLETIICMKLCANENEFVYLSKDGELKYGNKNEYGQNILHAFGGGERSRKEVISSLRFMVESEPEV